MKQNDTRHTIKYTIPYEHRPLLKEANVKFVMQNERGKLLVNAPASVNLALGEVSYRLTALDTLYAGRHRAEFKIEYVDGGHMTFPQKGYLEVVLNNTIDADRRTLVIEDVALKQSLINQKFSELEEEVREWRSSVADDVKDEAIEKIELEEVNIREVVEARGGKKDLNERITNIDFEIIAHIADKKNPHGTTKNDVGLGNVPNWGAASKSDAEAGTNNTRMMSPLRTKEAILAFASEATIIPAIAGTVSGNDYPLGVTTFQHSNLSGYPTNHGSALNIKLSNLRCAQFYVPHARTEADTGVYFRHFYGEEGWTDFWQVETTAGAQAKVDAHANDKSNPHGVTKSQIGLGSVDNIKQASKIDFDAHVNNKSNPHAVTKAQVGLSNVDNAKQATKAEFDAFVALTNNPHNVTKSQVGLGSVPNWGGATQAEAQAGTNNAKIMTPLRTKEAFNAFANQQLSYVRASLQAGWTHHSDWPVRYAKDAAGNVYIEGQMHGGAISNSIDQFVLPEDYRPASFMYFVCTAQPNGDENGTARIRISATSGAVRVQNLSWPGATQWVALNIVFKAGN